MTSARPIRVAHSNAAPNRPSIEKASEHNVSIDSDRMGMHQRMYPIQAPLPAWHPSTKNMMPLRAGRSCLSSALALVEASRPAAGGGRRTKTPPAARSGRLCFGTIDPKPIPNQAREPSAALPDSGRAPRHPRRPATPLKSNGEGGMVVGTGQTKRWHHQITPARQGTLPPNPC